MQKNKGFTLIELLVVIAVLGILMAAVLAGIDPLQQIKKGRDTSTRSLMVEYSNALLRYNGIKGIFPWNNVTVATAALTSFNSNTTQDLINSGELKTNFLQAAGANLSKIYLTGDSVNVTLCFQPESKAFRADPQAMYNNGGVNGAGCPEGNNANCHICIIAR